MKTETAKESEPFDLESVYDSEIEPLMAKIIKICTRHNMPMLATFMYQHNHGESEEDAYCTTSLGGIGGWKPERIIKATSLIRRGPVFAAFTVTEDLRA